MSESTRGIVIQHNDDADKWAASEDRVPVFTIVDDVNRDDNGEPIEHVYTMPAAPVPALALHYFRYQRLYGPDIASSWLIEEAVGRAGYDALANDLTGTDASAQLAAIQTLILKVALGNAPKAQGA